MNEQDDKGGLFNPGVPVVTEYANPNATKRRRKRKTAWDKLTPQKQVFVNEVLSGTPASHAVTKILGVEDKKKAEKKAYDLVQSPSVQNALQERLNQMYPNLSEGVAKKLKLIMEQPIKFEKEAPGITVNEYLKVVEFLSTVQGWKAPSKSVSLKANVTNFQWPGSK